MGDCLTIREFHINIKKTSIGSYKIENDKHAYCFTEDDYNRMHIELPAGYKLIFNNYQLSTVNCQLTTDNKSKKNEPNNKLNSNDSSGSV